MKRRYLDKHKILLSYKYFRIFVTILNNNIFVIFSYMSACLSVNENFAIHISFNFNVYNNDIHLVINVRKVYIIRDVLY